MKPRRWTTVRNRCVVTTPIFDLHRARRSHPERRSHDFYVLRAPDWVNIVPLTARNEVVMVRQYRHGISGFTLEIPGGMVDPGDRNPRLAARREMVEETGYDSSRILRLGAVHPNPAIMDNLCHSFVAVGVRPVARPQLDGTEETEVVTVPLRDIKKLIAGGKITHALVITAFSFLHAYNPPRL